MKKLLTTIMAAAMLISAAIPVFAAEADPEIAFAKSGDKTLTGVTANGGWNVTADALTTTETNSNFVFTNDKMEAGKITATFDRTSVPEGKSGHDGIIFCVSDDATKFWETQVNSYYFLFVQGDGMKIGLAKSGKLHTWSTFSDRYEIPEEDRTGVYTITAEWDCTGTIKCYLNEELVQTWTDSNPLPGSRYGLRAASVGVSFTEIVAEPAAPAADAPRNGQAEAIPGTAVVDGVIDEAWAKAPVYSMDEIVVLDSAKDENGNPTKTDSSSVKFRMMYSGTKVYMLAEVEDDKWMTGSGTNWQNDSLMIFVSENGLDRGTKNENRYCMVAFFENYDEANANCTGFFTRNDNGTNVKAKEHAVVKNGNKAVMELSFELNNETPVEGGMIAMDLQYNDADSVAASSSDNNRSIVWAWSCSANEGPNNVRDGVNGWGDVTFVAAPAEDPTTPITPVKPPKTGDTVLLVSALALLAVSGAVVITRRRKVSK